MSPQAGPSSTADRPRAPEEEPAPGPGRRLATLIVAGLAAPLGALALGWPLASWAQQTQQGMTSFAAVVAGLAFGPAILALVAFAICAALPPRPARPWRAILVMATGCGVGIPVCIALVAIIAIGGDPGVAAVALVIAAVVAYFAGAAYVALTVGQSSSSSS